MAILSGLTISGGGITIVGGMPPTDPYFMYNTLLLPGNGTNGAQNNTFTDGSTNSLAITRNGNTTQGTFSPYGGNWSNYFDGTGDYLTTPSTLAMALGSTFTVECWIYVLAWNVSSPTILDVRDSNIVGAIYLENNGTARMQTTATSTIASQTGITLNTWIHVAFVSDATSSRVYVNGSNTGATNQGQALFPTTAKVGFIGADFSGGYGFNGYISNLRVIKGTALYTANFIPSTTPLTPITNTSLLTCADNRLIDDSINNFTITRNGGVIVQRFSPFSPSSVTPTSYSGNFDGTGDYLSLATNAAFNITYGSTDSFICEFWVYFSSVAANTSLVDNGGLSGATFSNWQIALDASQQFRIVWGTPSSQDGILSSSVIPTVGQWYHVAMVKTNADWALFINSTRVISYNGINTASKDSATPLFIAYGLATTAGGNGFNGLISNVRIYKGATASAPYLATSTTITVPTSPLTSITNTSLLTCQSPTFIDNSTNNFAITAFGNSQPSIQNPFGFTTATTNGYTTNTIGGSGYFDGTGDYLSTSANATFTFGTNDHTIEFYYYLPSTSLAGGYATQWKYSSGSTQQATNDYYFQIGTAGGSNVGLLLGGGGSWGVLIQPSVSINAFVGVWTHIAWTRSGNTFRLFFNGVVVGTATYAGSITAQSGPMLLGQGGASEWAGGYYSDFRVNNGTAVYTSNFVPPSQPITAVTNTVLLLNITNAGIIDNAMMNNLETVGNAQISTTQSQFGGSSMYFDGTGDWLVTPISTSLGMGTGDFTIEGWFYATSPTYTQGLFHINAAPISGTVAGYAIGVTASGEIQYYAGNTFSTSSSTITANTWTHLALVRSAGTVKVYVNGILPTSGGSIADSQNVTSALAYLGVFYSVSGGVPAMTGYIDDFRVTKGYARYTANFTPPTTAFSVY